RARVDEVATVAREAAFERHEVADFKRVALPALAKQRVRTAHLERPADDGAVGRRHVRVDENVRVRPLDFRDLASQRDRLVDIVLRRERVMSGRGERSTRQHEPEQQSLRHDLHSLPVPSRPMRFTNCSFSKQTSSMSSASTTTRWRSVTVHGFVYPFGSSTVALISIWPKSSRRISSRILAASVTTLPFQSIHVSSRMPIVSTTSVSPSHFADE